MRHQRRSCPSCQRDGLYVHTAHAGSELAALLPKTGTRFRSAKVNVFACSRCGHLDMFLDDEARSKVGESDKWEKV